MGALQVLTIPLRLLLESRAALVAENLALRQQVALLRISKIGGRAERLIRKRVLWGARPSTAVAWSAPFASRGAHRTP